MALREKMDHIAEWIKDHGLNPNKYRMTILSYLKANMNHPTAEQVFEHVKNVFPQISYATVYNNLNRFVEKKMISTLPLIGSSRATRFDANLKPHDHFQCQRCEQIYDILKSTKNTVGILEGHRIHSASIVYLGICSKCRRENSF